MSGVRIRSGRAIAVSAFGWRSVLSAFVAFAVVLCSSQLAQATLLGLPEEAGWSDMAFPTGVTGNYNSGALSLTVAASPSNLLEIGGEFGPGGAGAHYGSGGTLGGAFSATLNVSGVVIQPDGTVTNGGTVTMVLNGSAPDSIGADYGIANGAQLLVGSVLGVLLDATGDNTLDVLFSISGGALQNENPLLGRNFATDNLGLLRVAGVTMPSDWTNSFSLNGATINVFGIPEPSSLALVLLGTITALTYRGRRGPSVR